MTLNGRTHLVFSAENPLHPPKVDKMPSHDEVVRFLESVGEKVFEATWERGGQKKKSIFVLEPKNINGLYQLAEDLGQESVIFSQNGRHELKYLNGPQRGKSIHTDQMTIFPEPPDDNYTTIHMPGGNCFYFRYNFDLGDGKSGENLNKSHDLDDLQKAIDGKTWNSFVEHHNKHAVPDIVDADGHINYFNNTHAEYLDSVLYSPKKSKSKKMWTSGISKKMIHHIRGDDGAEQIYMAKPYYTKIEGWAKPFQKHPIKGWASLTTRKMFEAASIPHLCEDLSAHIYGGVPLVISKFNHKAQHFDRDELAAPFNQSGSQGHSGHVNLADSVKIIFMDFLMNNQDRHSGNLLVANKTPLAIDHERNFQFFKSLHRPKEKNFLFSPNYFWENSVFGLAIPNLTKSLSKDLHAKNEIIDWWHSSKGALKDELERNLNFIKDDTIKKHIRDNFNSRWDFVDSFMNHKKMDDLFDPHNGIKNVPFERKKI